MGKITGFLEFERHDRSYEPVAERVKNFDEFVIPLSEKELRDQAARCMNCGVPYCHGTGSVAPGTPGCPVNNQIPDWNDLVYKGNREEASRNLHSTNNIPEFTGRNCPAPCEASCTLNIIDSQDPNKSNEHAIDERAWENGWLPPVVAAEKSGKKIAVVGSGPAGLACAQQLARVGHEVHVFEMHAKACGLLRYGIPDFKMEKWTIDRRIKQMEAEGVVFHYGKAVGGTSPGAIDPKELLKSYDAVALTGGAEAPRDLPVPGRDLSGSQYAMMTQKFSGENGKVTKLHCVHVDAKFQPVPGTEFELPADLILLAMGFVHPVHEGLLKSLGVDLDPRGNVRAATTDYKTSVAKVFTSGDMRRGQSLVVWAIREGRQCAASIDQHLMGSTTLPR